jgi:hypothetical protein
MPKRRKPPVLTRHWAKYCCRCASGNSAVCTTFAPMRNCVDAQNLCRPRRFKRVFRLSRGARRAVRVAQARFDMFYNAVDQALQKFAGLVHAESRIEKRKVIKAKL